MAGRDLLVMLRTPPRFMLKSHSCGKLGTLQSILLGRSVRLGRAGDKNTIFLVQQRNGWSLRSGVAVAHHTCMRVKCFQYHGSRRRYFARSRARCLRMTSIIIVPKDHSLGYMQVGKSFLMWKKSSSQRKCSTSPRCTAGTRHRRRSAVLLKRCMVCYEIGVM